MKKATSTILSLFSIAALAGSLGAQPLELRTPAAGDLAADELVRLPAEKGLQPGVSQEAVDFAYALDAAYAHGGELALTASRPFRAESREYFVDVDASALARGVTVYTTAPGALLRIHPVGQAGLNEVGPIVDPNGLTVTSPDGAVYGAGEAFEQIVTPDQLRASGVAFAEGTVALQLDAAVGAGALTLAAPALRGGGTYTVHVFDRHSPIALEVQTGRADYLHGDRLRVEATFAGAAVDLGQVDGFVTAPDGRAWPLEVTTRGGRIVGSLGLDAGFTAAPGLWQVHFAARGAAQGLEVVRNARTAFAAHLPTARLGDVARVEAKDGVALRFGVEVGTAGRYEVRGVLYGTRDGRLTPMAMGHAADWLDASGDLTVTFPVADGFTAPYELRDLQLLDQGRMGLLHRQGRALQLGR